MKVNKLVCLDGFSKSFQRFQNPSVSKSYKEFINLRTINRPLPSYFQDHMLAPPFNGHIRECHLDIDVLLFYYEEDNKINLIAIDKHSRIEPGTKSEKQAAKRWNSLPS